MSTMTQKMGDTARTTEQKAADSIPKNGDVFRCEKCGMELRITKECGCKDPGHVHLECCGQSLSKV